MQGGLLVKLWPMVASGGSCKVVCTVQLMSTQGAATEPIWG